MDDVKGGGWIFFAGTMMFLAGVLNGIWGFAAIDNANFFLEDDRYVLGAGASFSGPAVVEELDSTVVVHPGFGLEVDDIGDLVIRKEPA